MAVQIEKVQTGWIVSKFFETLPAAMKGVSELSGISENAFRVEQAPAPDLPAHIEALAVRDELAEAE